MSTVKDSISNDIVAAIDGSLPSKNAAKAAILFAQKQHSKICGLYVVGSRLVMEDGVAVKTELPNQTGSDQAGHLIDQFKSQGDEVLDWLEQQCYSSGVLVTTEICFGGIPKMILEGAEKSLFLAMGRRGRAHRNGPASLGDNFERIISHQNVPILIGGREKISFKRIWIILSTSEGTTKLVSWGKLFQNAFSSDILISPYNGDEALTNLASTALIEFRQGNLAGYKQLYSPVNTGGEIVEALKTNIVDLIIMEGYQRNTLSILIDKQPLNDILQDSEVMVFAV